MESGCICAQAAAKSLRPSDRESLARGMENRIDPVDETGHRVGEKQSAGFGVYE
jgi:hypothetical protein